MAQTQTIFATLLFVDGPAVPLDEVGRGLRAQAALSGRPDDGAPIVRGRTLSLSTPPFSITLEMVDGPSETSTFAGSLGGASPPQRAELASAIASHTCRAQLTVTDTRSEEGIEAPRRRREHMRFAQDITRIAAQQMAPTAVQWHPSNLLIDRAALQSAKPDSLHLPLYLRLRCVSAAIPDQASVNMAQCVDGAEAITGRPLHIMSTSLDRSETLALAIAFIERQLDGETRPAQGAVFRDRKGNRVMVVDEPARRGFPRGLTALVEVDESERPTMPAPQVAGLRDQVARSETERVNSRPLRVQNRLLRRMLESRAESRGLTEAQARAVESAVTAKETSEPVDHTPDQLRALRALAAANPRPKA